MIIQYPYYEHPGNEDISFCFRVVIGGGCFKGERYMGEVPRIYTKVRESIWLYNTHMHLITPKFSIVLEFK